MVCPERHGPHLEVEHAEGTDKKVLCSLHRLYPAVRLYGVGHGCRTRETSQWYLHQDAQEGTQCTLELAPETRSCMGTCHWPLLQAP